ncbi:MAG: molecular chaperone DnaJ [Clostridiales bacterium]|jgi:molecular chaperone DnaJ|nr:molecular chaperone DnaJ [Clostridiales bacterium]
MAEKRDYYEVLGISKGASEAEIKKAFRQQAKKFHPDVNSGDKGAEAKFKEVNEAYDVLSDSQKRSRYDQMGHAGVDPNAYGGGGAGFGGVDFDLGDIFDSFFGGGFGGRSSGRARNAPQKGPDLRYNVELAFEEAAFGVEKEIHLNRNEKCTTCGGTGARDGSAPTTCSACGGSGQVQVRQNTPFGQFSTVRTCETCHGEGKIVTNPCAQCGGGGKIKKSARIKVKIPGGIDSGQSISLRGEGEPGARGGPNGDLYVTVRVKRHALFSRDGVDVICEMPITFAQAALGSEVEVPTLDGKVKYQIPEGTQTGTVFRLKNKGIPYLRGNGRGDQFVKTTIEVPKRLNEKQKRILRDFADVSGDEVHDQRRGFFDKMRQSFGK